MRRWPDWFTYGRPFAHYVGAAMMAALAILGAFLSVWQVSKAGLPWWGWMLVGHGGLALLIYAHMRQWREWNKEIRNLRSRLGAEIRLASLEEIASRFPDAPYGRRAVFQTLKTFDTTSFNIVCTRPVRQDLLQVSFAGYGTYFSAQSVQEGMAAIVPIRITAPPFKPENSLIVEMFGPEPFFVVGVGLAP